MYDADLNEIVRYYLPGATSLVVTSEKDSAVTVNKAEKALLYVVADKKFTVLEHYVQTLYTLQGVKYIDRIEKKSEVSLASHGRTVFLDKNRAFIAEGDNGVEVFDVSDLHEINMVGSFKTGFASDVEAKGAYIYVADRQNGLKIYKDMLYSSSSSSSSSSSLSSSSSSSNSSSSSSLSSSSSNSSGNNSSSSSSSSSSSLSSSSSSSSTSSSLSSSSVGNGGVFPGFNFAQIADKSFDLQGYFYHYGNGAFDWLYIAKNGQLVAKLEGMDEQGYFIWILLQDYIGSVTVAYDAATRVGTITLDNIKSNAPDYLKNLEGSTFTADGYFFNFGNGAFDWLYLTKIVRYWRNLREWMNKDILNGHLYKINLPITVSMEKNSIWVQ